MLMLELIFAKILNKDTVSIYMPSHVQLMAQVLEYLDTTYGVKASY